MRSKYDEIECDDDKETDVQEVFFVGMQLSSDNKQILIENELENPFSMNLEDRTITANRFCGIANGNLSLANARRDPL